MSTIRREHKELLNSNQMCSHFTLHLAWWVSTDLYRKCCAECSVWDKYSVVLLRLDRPGTGDCILRCPLHSCSTPADVTYGTPVGPSHGLAYGESLSCSLQSAFQPSLLSRCSSLPNRCSPVDTHCMRPLGYISSLLFAEQSKRIWYGI